MERLSGWLLREEGIREPSRKGERGKNRESTNHINCFGDSR